MKKFIKNIIKGIIDFFDNFKGSFWSVAIKHLIMIILGILLLLLLISGIGNFTMYQYSNREYKETLFEYEACKQYNQCDEYDIKKINKWLATQKIKGKLLDKKFLNYTEK